MPPINLHLIDLTPRFLTFYTHATQQPITPDQRWQLWQQHYGISGYTPDERGQQTARRRLDEIWSHYPSILPLIRQGTNHILPAAHDSLTDVATTLHCTQSLDIQLSIFVGMFDNNAFAYSANNIHTIMMPLEMSEHHRAYVLTHELTHAVHITTASLSGGWQHSFAEHVLLEGLATRMVSHTYPDLDSPTAIFPIPHPYSPDWYQRCQHNQTRILTYIQEHLQEDCSPMLSQPGVEEYYYAGWLIVGQLLQQGLTLADTAHIPATNIPSYVNNAINTLLTQ